MPFRLSVVSLIVAAGIFTLAIRRPGCADSFSIPHFVAAGQRPAPLLKPTHTKPSSHSGENRP